MASLKQTELSQPDVESSLSARLLATLLIGITSGLCGLLLALLLRFIQHLAYGYSPFELVSNVTFLQGVEASSSSRRVIVLVLCGLVAGIGWWLLFRFAKPLVNIKSALKDKTQLPIVSTLIHAILQIVTVGLGSPLGREAAPREAGTVFAQWASQVTKLSLKDARIMLACGAGASFAAVYNVPFSGALFSLEVLLCTLDVAALIPAFVTSLIATAISWSVLGNVPQYDFVLLQVNNQLLLWSILCGPILGACAYWFIQLANRAKKNAPKQWPLPLTCLVNFLMIGLLAIYFPVLLGNGKSPARLEFDNALSLELSLLFLVLRVFIICTSLRAGAHGGLLTPSMANGALLGVVLGGLFNYFWPGTALNAFAFIGATAFLGAAQKMPITAIVLLLEMTQVEVRFLVPMLFAVTGAVFAYNQFEFYFSGLSRTLPKAPNLED